MLTLLTPFLNSEFKLLSLLHITPFRTESNCPQSCTKPNRNRTILLDQLFSTAFLSIQCNMSSCRRLPLSQACVRRRLHMEERRLVMSSQLCTLVKKSTKSYFRWLPPALWKKAPLSIDWTHCLFLNRQEFEKAWEHYKNEEVLHRSVLQRQSLLVRALLAQACADKQQGTWQ